MTKIKPNLRQLQVSVCPSAVLTRNKLGNFSANDKIVLTNQRGRFHLARPHKNISLPIVEIYESENISSINLKIRQVFPTPLSPRMRILYVASYSLSPITYKLIKTPPAQNLHQLKIERRKKEALVLGLARSLKQAWLPFILFTTQTQ